MQHLNKTKIAVVTGANKGIGFAIVKNLAPKFDGIVYLTGILNYYLYTFKTFQYADATA